jgi:acyl-coenzyme A thioesterase 13
MLAHLHVHACPPILMSFHNNDGCLPSLHLPTLKLTWNKRFFHNMLSWLKITVVQRSSVRMAVGSRLISSVATAGDDKDKMSFIDKAKAYGANALLGLYTHRGDRFDTCLKSMKVDKIGDGIVTCSLPVDRHLQNAYTTLHGGAICTIVDVVGTLALLSIDASRPGVSVDLNVNFISAAKAGEDVVIEGIVLKSGRRLGFSQVEIRHRDSGKLIASGRHTKSF